MSGEIRICTKCKKDVLPHDESDGDLSCECEVRYWDDYPPDSWIYVELRTATLCGLCGSEIQGEVYRCADCDTPFHRTCLDHHCRRGNQPQELRSENMFLKGQITLKDARLAEYEKEIKGLREELRGTTETLEVTEHRLRNTENLLSSEEKRSEWYQAQRHEASMDAARKSVELANTKAHLGNADARLAEYAEREGRMRKAGNRLRELSFQKCRDHESHAARAAWQAALSGSSPCPHAAEVERLKAELKTANEGMTVAHMVGYHKRDEEVEGLEETLALADQMAEAAEKFKESCDTYLRSPYPNADAVLGNPEKFSELCAALSAFNAARRK
jgi:DNA repair exonuclease SbcCD ATPase subunit